MDIDRIDQLEMRVAEQDRMLEELSEVMASQQKDIERLRARLTRSDDRIAELEAGLPNAASEKPPHY
ncbi:MAG: SlyX family protein [Pseudomonadota bacterium]